MSRLPSPEKFWGQVSPEPNSGCWLWVGCTDKSGYGYCGSSVAGAERLVHRIAWRLAHGGRPVPEGKNILHACVGMRSCVNPAHLRPGTPHENTADMMHQGRWRGGAPFHKVKLVGELNPNAKLSNAAMAQIQEDRARGMPLKAIGVKYGVTPQAVCIRLKRMSVK